jgi:uncharacterized protein YggE
MSDETMTGDVHEHQGPEGRHDGPRFAPRRPRLLSWLLLMVTVLVVVAVGFIGVVLGHSGSPSRNTVTVTGSGTVQGIPDTINFQIGINTINALASTALTNNNLKVAALERALKRNGVTAKEMQTSGLDIYENTNDQGTVTGFTVSDTLSVTMHKVQRAGAAIDAAARIAGNGVVLNGVSFTITNDSKLLQAARTRAMDNARLAAGQLAKAGDTHVTAIVKITDQENQSSGIYYPTSFAAGADLKSAVPLQTGSQPVNVQVTVIYSLSS